MKCPNCNHDRTFVKMTIPLQDTGGNQHVHRRYVCARCMTRFETMEDVTAVAEETDKANIPTENTRSE